MRQRIPGETRESRVFSDWMRFLPTTGFKVREVDGFDVIKWIRQQPSLKRVPVVVLADLGWSCVQKAHVAEKGHYFLRVNAVT